MPALQADTKVQPRLARGKALLATGHALRQSRQPDVVAMGARHENARIAASAGRCITRTRGMDTGARKISARSGRPPSSPAGGVFIVIEAVGQLTQGTESLAARWYVFAVIGVALMIDVFRIVVSLRTAPKYKSAALRSNAFHFAGDMAGSLAVLGELIAVAAGLKAGDAISGSRRRLHHLRRRGAAHLRKRAC